MADLRGKPHDLTSCVDCGGPRGDVPATKNGSDRARCQTCRRARYRDQNRRYHPPNGRPANRPGQLGKWNNPKLAPVLHPTMQDIAWAAGVYEGEGSAYAVGKSVKISVVQKDRWLVDRLRDLFGGSVGVTRQVRPVRGPVEYHIWALAGPRGRGFALTIFSYLSPRRREQLRTAFMKGG